MQEEKKVISWYKCSHDIWITVVITVIVFGIDPITRGYKFFHMKDDMGLLSAQIIATIVIIESLLICLKHYWTWVIITNFSVTAAAFMRQRQSLQTMDVILWDIVANGLIFLVFSVVGATIIYVIRKKIKAVQNGRG